MLALRPLRPSDDGPYDARSCLEAAASVWTAAVAAAMTARGDAASRRLVTAAPTPVVAIAFGRE
jgi:hypothetical protein